MDKSFSIRRLAVDFSKWLLVVAMAMGVYFIPMGAAENALPPVAQERRATAAVETPTPLEEPAPAALSAAPPVSAAEEETEGASAPFHSLIHKAAVRHQVDAALVKAIIKAESGYNPQAVSNKGARGLMQLMPRTAKAMGLEKDLFDPEGNIETGVKYFKKLLDCFDGDVPLALAAYNAGIGRVRHYGGIPPIKATKYYVEKVLEYYAEYKQEKAATGEV